MNPETTTDLAAMDATAQAELVRNGAASALELVDAAIARIEALNPELNAVIRTRFDEAREDAQGELPDGPFKGVPFLVKDLGPSVMGQPLHMGMKLLKEADFRGPLTDWLSERMQASGLISLGQTNTPELGLIATTESEAYGPARNPWNPEHSTLGSSGGAGAAVASGMVPLAHANDGGGSIRLPAAANGLVGLKPSRGRITLGPILGDALGGLTIDLCVSRSVRDTAAFLDAVEGPGPGDPYWAERPQRPYADEVGADPGKLKIAMFTDLGAAIEVDPEMARSVEQSASEIEQLGHDIDACPPLELGGRALIETFTMIWAAGVSSTLGQLGALLGREITEDDVEPVTWALYEGGQQHSAGDFLSARAQMQGFARMVAMFMEANGYDLLMTPSFGKLPPRIGEWDQRAAADPMDIFRANEPVGVFTAFFNGSGQPAISLPMRTSESGLPVGTQFVGKLGDEDLLLRLAAQVEAAYPWADRTPKVFAS